MQIKQTVKDEMSGAILVEFASSDEATQCVAQLYDSIYKDGELRSMQGVVRGLWSVQAFVTVGTDGGEDDLDALIDYITNVIAY